MLVRRINFQNVIKSVFDKPKVFGTTSGTPRFISDNQVINSNLVNSLQGNFDGNGIQTRNKSTTVHPKPDYDKGPKRSNYELLAYFPEIAKDCREIISEFDADGIIADWFDRCLQFNLPRERKHNLLVAEYAYQQINKGNVTPENMRLATVVGWCVEFSQVMFQLYDDLIDGGRTRWGQPCWFRLDTVGMVCVNDGLLMENIIFEILRKYMGDKPYYMQMVDLFRQTSFLTSCGQCLDFVTTAVERDVERFTMEKYRAIVRLKGTVFVYYFPAAAAMVMSGITDPKAYKEAERILFEAGIFFQVQNDYWDVYGYDTGFGAGGLKMSSDIQENKCSWLAVKTMEIGSPEQKQIMKECYGQTDPEKVARVKQVYDDLKMPEIYAETEERTYNLACKMIRESPIEVPHEAFLKVVDVIFLKDL